MGQLAAPFMIGSTVLNANAKRQEGIAQQAQANSQAAQLNESAGQDRAASIMAAAEQRRQARLAQSALQARGGGTDTGTINLDKGIQGEGEYRALTALFQGEEQARGKEHAAQNAIAQGKAAAKAARIGAFSSILSGGVSLYDKYGGNNKTTRDFDYKMNN